MNPVKQVQQQPDGALFTMGTGTLKVQVCSDSVIHVLYSPTATFPKRTDFVVTKESWPAAQFTMQSTDDAVTLTTSLLKITVTRKDGAIAYADMHGESLLQEPSRSMTPEKVNGEDTYRAESFVSIYGSHEALYGLGQHQAGVWNYRGESVDISQDNSNISVPADACRAKVTAFSGTTLRAADSTIDLPIISTSALKSPTSSTTTFSTVPTSTRSLPAIATSPGRLPCSASGPTASGSARIATNRRMRSSALPASIATYTSPSTTSCRTGFGGIAKASSSLTRIIPIPKAMVDQLHNENFHLMISIWPFFEPGSTNYDYMEKQGLVRRQIQVREASLPYQRDGRV